MSTFSWGRKRQTSKKKNLEICFPISLSVSLGQCAFLLSVIGPALLLSLWQSAPVVNVFVYVHESLTACGWMTPNLHVAGLPSVWREMGTSLRALNQTPLIDLLLLLLLLLLRTHFCLLTCKETPLWPRRPPIIAIKMCSVIMLSAEDNWKAWQADSWPVGKHTWLGWHACCYLERHSEPQELAGSEMKGKKQRRASGASFYSSLLPLKA